MTTQPNAIPQRSQLSSATRAQKGAVGFSKTMGRSIAPLADSLIPAALACASYGDLSYAWDVALGADPQAWMGLVDAKSVDNLPRALFLKSVARAATAEELGLNAAAAGATFERGVWSHGSLASALCAVVELPGGVKELHLSVRGTDAAARARPWIQALPKFLGAQTMAAYFGVAYPSIDGHAAHFEALAKAVAKTAADPGQGFTRVVVSGHSLGAAAAEALIPLLKSHGAPVSAHLFGNPGHGAGVIGLPKLIVERAAGRVAKTALAAFSVVARAAAASLAHRAPAPADALWKAGTGAWNKMLKMGQPEASDDQFNWRCSGDPIPKIGALLYGTSVRARKADTGRSELHWSQYWKLWKTLPVLGSRHSMPLYAASNASALNELVSSGNGLEETHQGIWERHLASHDEALRMRGKAAAQFDAAGWATARARIESEGASWPTDQAERLRQLVREQPSQEALMGAALDQAALRDKLARRRARPAGLEEKIQKAREEGLAWRRGVAP